jgi:hypothetical protein
MAQNRRSDKRAGVFAFLQRHKVSLVFLGAILAFVTFVIKDNLRDHLRETTDAVENARRVFLVGRGIDGVSSSVADVSTFLRSKLSNFPSSKPDQADPWKWIPPRDERAEALLLQINNDVTYAQQGLLLCEEVPGSENDKKQITERIRDFKTAADQLQQWTKKVVAPDSSTATRLSEIEKEAQINLLSSAVETALNQSDELRQNLDTLLEKAEHRQRQATRRYKAFSYCSNFLFIISLVVSTCGAIAGVELPKDL